MYACARDVVLPYQKITVTEYQLMYEFSWKSCLWPSTTRVNQIFCQQNILPSPRFAQLLIREDGSLWIRPMNFKSGVVNVKVAFRGFRVFQKNINTLLGTAHIVTDLYLISD